MIELRKIGHVVGVARYGGFAKAAAAMSITQSALTKSIQSIEKRLGIALFDRGSRGVRLTAEGEWFVERGSRLLAEADQLNTDARAVRTLRKGRIRVAAAPAALDMVWIDEVPRFAKLFPNIRIELTAESIERARQLLLNGDLDMAVGALSGLRDDPGLDVEDLYSSRVEIFVRRGHPLDRDEPPDLASLFAFPMVMPSPAEPHTSMIRQLAKEHRSAFVQPHLITDSFSVTRRIVQETDAFSAVIAKHSATAVFKRHFRSWPGWAPLSQLTISLATRTGWVPTPAARELIKIYRNLERR